jgi:hypothetical protein
VARRALADPVVAMKVLDLSCSNGHGFEGWFGSEDDYQTQNGRGLIECPLCGDKVIRRLPSAPRLNLSAAGKEPPPTPPAAAPAAQPPAAAAPAPAEAEVHARFLRAVREVLANTEDVGRRFATEARAIHHGEAPERPIRGQATADEARELAEEGIEVALLPVPAALKGPLQ